VPIARRGAELRIPKLRQGSYFPSFLEPCRRSEQALLAVVQQASTSIGTSPLTERVDLDPITGRFPLKRDTGPNESKV
jgi:putative transposase